MFIPKHSRFKLLSDDGSYDIFPDTVNFIIDEDITIQSSSTFSDLYKTPDNSVFDAMGLISIVSNDFVQKNKDAEGWTKVTRGFAKIGQNLSGKYKEFGFQSYKSTEPLQLKIKVSLYATWNAKIQVYNPVLMLMLLPLPTTAQEQDKYNNSKLIIGSDTFSKLSLNQVSYPSTENKPKNTNNSNGGNTLFHPLIPPGPDPMKILEGLGKGEFKSNSTGRVFSCQLGDMLFKDIFIDSVTPTFSKEKMMVDGNYYPMSCQLDLSIRSIFIMTRGYILNSMDIK